MLFVIIIYIKLKSILFYAKSFNIYQNIKYFLIIKLIYKSISALIFKNWFFTPCPTFYFLHAEKLYSFLMQNLILYSIISGVFIFNFHLFKCYSLFASSHPCIKMMRKTVTIKGCTLFTVSLNGYKYYANTFKCHYFLTLFYAEWYMH